MPRKSPNRDEADIVAKMRVNLGMLVLFLMSSLDRVGVWRIEWGLVVMGCVLDVVMGGITQY